MKDNERSKLTFSSK